MRRLVWMGVGAVGAVIAIGRLKQAVRRFTPEGVAEQVEDVGARTTTALRGAVAEFRTARDERERDLVTSLLVTPESGEYVPRRDRAPSAGPRDDRSDAFRDDRGGGSVSRPSGRVDVDEPLYDF